MPDGRPVSRFQNISMENSPAFRDPVRRGVCGWVFFSPSFGRSGQFVGYREDGSFPYNGVTGNWPTAEVHVAPEEQANEKARLIA